MAEVLPDNGLTSTLSGAISNSATTIPIQSADAAVWPASGEYRAVLWTDPTAGPWELVKIVSGQGTASLGVQRAAEAYHGDQTARAWPSGTGIAAVLTRDGLSDVIAGSGGTSSVSGSHTANTGWSDSAANVATLAVPSGAQLVYFDLTVTGVTGTPNDGAEVKIINDTTSTELLAQHMHGGSAPPVGYEQMYSISPDTATMLRFVVGVWNYVSNPGTISFIWTITWVIPQNGLIIRTLDVVPASGATTVTLPDMPDSVIMVARNGVVQSQAAGHYSISGNVVTFAASFDGTDRVIIDYALPSVVGTSATDVQTTDTVPPSGTSTVVLPVTPDNVTIVARNGVVQSQGAGHYTVSGDTITFAAPFDGTDRVVVEYKTHTGAPASPQSNPEFRGKVKIKPGSMAELVMDGNPVSAGTYRYHLAQDDYYNLYLWVDRLNPDNTVDQMAAELVVMGGSIILGPTFSTGYDGDPNNTDWTGNVSLSSDGNNNLHLNGGLAMPGGGIAGSIIMWNPSVGAFTPMPPTNITIPGLPTVDPHVNGRLWNNAGVLNVSAG